jgi:hypothetical protein
LPVAGYGIREVSNGFRDCDERYFRRVKSVANVNHDIDNLVIGIVNLMKGIADLVIGIVNLMKGIADLAIGIVNLVKGIADLVNEVP